MQFHKISKAVELGWVYDGECWISARPWLQGDATIWAKIWFDNGLREVCSGKIWFVDNTSSNTKFGDSYETGIIFETRGVLTTPDSVRSWLDSKIARLFLDTQTQVEKSGFIPTLAQIAQERQESLVKEVERVILDFFSMSDEEADAKYKALLDRAIGREIGTGIPMTVNEREFYYCYLINRKATGLSDGDCDDLMTIIVEIAIRDYYFPPVAGERELREAARK